MTDRVLIVDDEPNMRWVLKEALTTAGYEVLGAGSGQEALSELAGAPVDLVLLDLKLKGMDGLATLRRIRERWPEVVVIMLTAHGTVATAVEAMQLGAADYLRKPFDVEEITFKIQRAIERRALQVELRRLRQVAALPANYAVIGAHPLWQRCLEQIRSCNQLDMDILLVGPAGAGKATLARLAHTTSTCAEAPLIEVDLRALAPELQQPVLFAREGATAAWARAGGGSLLLRHSELLTPDAWTMLGDMAGQREGRGPRLLLTATVLPTEATVLAVGHVAVPALQERHSDIPLLACALLPEHAITPAALALLEEASWPGNVAELRAVLERAQTLAGAGPIDVPQLPERVLLPAGSELLFRLPPEGLSLEEVEVSLIRQALELAGGNKTRAAELLGLSRHTLLYRLEKYQLG